ncbi:MAG: N-glycosylase/DNA lyase [Candidatus Methanomethylicaceae archaeon]
MLDDLLVQARALYNQRFGAECRVLSVSYKGRVICAEFGGNVITSCCAVDYFEDFALILEELSRVPHAVFFSANKHLEGFSVKIARLDFLEEIRSVMRDCSDTVKLRLNEFEEVGRDEISAFKELCFCILTANFSAERGIKLQRAIDDGFISLPKEDLCKRLKELGHRFPSSRGRYIFEARNFCGTLLETIRGFKSGSVAREWLTKNVNGIGYKEASHFLRNIGFKDLAIIDRHIINYFEEKGLTEKKTLTKRRYLELERILLAIADRLGITLAELDLYLWHLMTGKILK